MTERVLDGAVGETREAVIENGRVVEIALYRWSDRGRRARLGETFVARVRRVEKALRGAFLDLGLTQEQGFLPLEGAALAREGETLRVRVTREAAGGKSAVLARDGEAAPGAALGYDPEVLRAHEAQGAAPPADKERRASIDEAFEAALEKTAPIPGGGRLVVEPTSALIAIDVDAADRQGARDPERFARDLNIAAAKEALAQLRLRNLGGVVAIDFVAMKRAESRAALAEALKAAAAADPWGVRLAPLSRFGIVELSRARRARPHAEAAAESAETAALSALRLIENAAKEARGRVAVVALPPPAHAWLQSEAIPWRPALEARVGRLWRLEAAPIDAPRLRLE